MATPHNQHVLPQGLAIYPRPGDGKIISNQSLVLQKVKAHQKPKTRSHQIALFFNAYYQDLGSISN